MKHGTIILLISIPFAAVLMGAVMLYFAVQKPIGTLQPDSAPLTKTSWQQMEDRP